MEKPMDSEGGHPLQRYVPLAIWVGAVLLGLLIPLKILGIGYIPNDDAMRHVAKAISGKAWSDVLVLREGFEGDQHPGWHAILGTLHRTMNWDADTLINFSVAGLFVGFWLTMLASRKRPEAMLLALFLGSLLAPIPFIRPLFGRPFTFVMIVYVVLLLLWTRREKTTAWQMALSVGLIGVSVWVHGGWYLFGIVMAAFALVGEWRKAVAFTGCWLAGTLLGASFTGHPFEYLKETLLHMFLSLGGNQLERMLVPEFKPYPGDFALMAAVVLALLWRQARGEWRKEVVFNPIFAVMVLGWFLGLKVGRFWMDWGFPAALLWLAQELEAVLEARAERGGIQTAVLAAFAGAGVFIATTRDLGDRWTGNLKVEFLTPDDPSLAGWLPEKGGIIYNPSMEVFYRTFYKNPHADWRYVQGFEPGIMQAEDLSILRKIQWDGRAKAFELWVAKMRPEDRMVLLQDAGAEPGVRGLQWRCASTDTWIGRLPRVSPPAKTNP